MVKPKRKIDTNFSIRDQGFPVASGGGDLVIKSCLTLETPWTVACQAPLSLGSSRQDYWSGLPFPSTCTKYVIF